MRPAIQKIELHSQLAPGAINRQCQVLQDDAPPVPRGNEQFGRHGDAIGKKRSVLVKVIQVFVFQGTVAANRPNTGRDGLTRGQVHVQAVFRQVDAQCGAVGAGRGQQILQRVLEPLSAPPRMRLKQIRQMRKLKIPVQAALEPLVPGVTDTRENLLAVLEKLADVGIRSRLQPNHKLYVLLRNTPSSPQNHGPSLAHFIRRG